MKYATTIIRRLPIVAAMLLATAQSAEATHHLIAAGDNWQSLQSRFKPGDEIILMPGRHKPATLDDVHGTAEQPIIIRGADAGNPPSIDADRYGIRLRNARHVRIADLAIEGATIHGISLEGSSGGAPAADDEPNEPSGDITLSNITLINTGPRGLRHAVNLQHVGDIRIESCRIEGWAGSAVEIVGCSDVVIQQCRFIGKEDHEQASGVRARAGTEGLRIEDCRFNNTGDQGVCIGAGSKLEEFSTPPADEAGPGSLYEATRVQVIRCVFKGGGCAIAFVNCKDVALRNSTIADPRRAIVSIRNEQMDPRFGAASSCILSSNLITWRKDQFSSLTHLGQGATTDGIMLEENLWWTENWPEVKDSLGPFPGTEAFPQVTDIDPKLDEQLKPTVEEAELFGAFSP